MRHWVFALLVLLLCMPNIAIPSCLAQSSLGIYSPEVLPVDALNLIKGSAAETVEGSENAKAGKPLPDSVGVPVLAEAFDSLSSSSSDFDLPAPRTMKGIFSTLGMYVSLPDYAKAKEAVLRVSYTCSELILDYVSSLTFYVNSIPVYSCPVVYSPTGPTLVYLRLPLELFTETYNLIQIYGYVRLSEGEGCSDQNAEGNWIQFQEQSTLRIAYDIIEGADYLGLYPFPFLSLADKEGKNLNISVSDTMDNGELAAALYTMADLGSEVANDNHILLTNWSHSDRERCVYFGLQKNTSDHLLALLEPNVVPSSGALIKRVRFEGRDLLLVVSGTGDALMEAARFLADDLRVTQIYSPFAFVTLGDADSVMASKVQKETVITNAYTLKDIIGRGMMLTGPFHQETTVFLPVPSDYLLSGQSRFDLLLRYSENLDFDRSMVTVYWGDIPLASRKLSRESVNGDMLTIVPAVDLIDTPGTYLRIAFELEVKDLECTPRQINMPWAYVAETSLIYLPEGRSGVHNLSSRPAPFQKNGSLNHVMVVLPNVPDPAELSLAGSVLSRYGAGTDAYGELSVVRASAFSPDDADKNIIAVGLGNNAFIASVNEHMYFRYNEDFASFLSNDKLALTPSYARNIGLVQLIDSPFADQRAILVLTAAADDGLARIEKLFSEQKLSWKLEKDAVIVDERSKVTSYTMRDDLPVQMDKLSWIDKIFQNKGDVIFSLIGIGVMLILLMTVILLIIRLRENSRKKS